MSTIFTKETQMNFEPHPKFQGVTISTLVTSQETEEISVCILDIDPGIEIPVHTNDPQVDSIFIVKGEGEAYINGAWQGVSAGDYICVPARTEHGVRNTGKDILRLFVVHSPPLL